MLQKRTFWFLLLIVSSIINCPAADTLTSENNGRWFLVAVVKNDISSEPSGFLTIACLDVFADVSIKMPTDIFDVKRPFTETRARLTREKSLEIALPKSQIAEKVGLGAAIDIRSTSNVAVTLLNQGLDNSADVSIIPPVAAYSTTYDVVTLPSSAWLLILAAFDDTTLQIKWGSKGSSFDVVCYKEAKCTKGGTNKIPMAAGNFFTLYTKGDQTDLTGTRVTTDKRVGCFVGNNLIKTSASRRPDFTMASMRPKNMWGYEHLIFHTFETGKCAKAIFYSQLPHTKIFVKRTNTITDMVLESAFESKEITLTGPEHRHMFLVTSDKPVAVLVTSLECGFDMPFTFFIVPMQLFVNKIFFRTPSFTGAPVEWRITIIAPTEKCLLVSINSVVYAASHWVKMEVSDKSNGTEIQYSFLSQPLHRETAYIVHPQPTVRFTAYLHWNAIFQAMATELGLTYHEVVAEGSCVKTDTVTGDLIDNDCDDQIDEELPNDYDDDGDGLVDEDNIFFRANGSWGAWQPWYCNAKCDTFGTLARRRECSHPLPLFGGYDCVGESSQIGRLCSAKLKAKILKSKECPQECPTTKFGAKCNYPCSDKCGGEVCDREDGSCLWCKEGRQISAYCDVESEAIDKRIVGEGGPSAIYIHEKSIADYWFIFMIIPILIGAAYIGWLMLLADKKEKEKQPAAAEAEEALADEANPEGEPQPQPEPETEPERQSGESDDQEDGYRESVVN